MELANPAYLWALLGLLIPLAIHLLSRKAGRVVQIGSIRHLTASSTRRFKSIRFNQYLLFALRALLVILFVLVLAGVTIPGSEARQKWVLVDGNPDGLSTLTERLDSLERAGYELRSFSQAFPLLAAMDSLPSAINYPHLLQQLGDLPVNAVVLARNRLQAFRGKRLALPGNVHWLQLTAADPVRESLWAVRLHPDTVRLLQGETGAMRTSFNHTNVYSAGERVEIDDPISGRNMNVQPAYPVRILLRARDDQETKARLLMAALEAVSVVGMYPIEVEEFAEMPEAEVAQTFDLIINLGSSELLNMDSVFQIASQETQNGRLLEQIGPFYWRLDPDVNRERLLQEHFPAALSRILLSDKHLEDQLRDWDQRTIDESVFFFETEEVTQAKSSGRIAIDKWLILLLAGALIIERIAAFYRKA